MIGKMDVSAAREMFDDCQMAEPGAGTIDPDPSSKLGGDNPRVPGAHDALAGAAKGALAAEVEDRADWDGADGAREAADQLGAETLRVVLSEHVMAL